MYDNVIPGDTNDEDDYTAYDIEAPKTDAFATWGFTWGALHGVAEGEQIVQEGTPTLGLSANTNAQGDYVFGYADGGPGDTVFYGGSGSNWFTDDNIVGAGAFGEEDEPKFTHVDGPIGNDTLYGGGG